MAVNKIYTMIMHDGSRHFSSLPETVDWDLLRDHVATLPGAEVTGFITDHVFEAWIDFTYQGYSFSINNQFGDYWFFVEDVHCPDKILLAVVTHCEQVTGEAT